MAEFTLSCAPERLTTPDGKIMRAMTAHLSVECPSQGELRKQALEATRVRSEMLRLQGSTERVLALLDPSDEPEFAADVIDEFHPEQELQDEHDQQEPEFDPEQPDPNADLDLDEPEPEPEPAYDEPEFPETNDDPFAE